MRSVLPLVALVLCVASVAHAHPLSFGVMTVEERADGRYDLELRFSGDEDAPSAGAPRIDEHCRLEHAIDVPLEWGVHVRGVLVCEGGLVGRHVGVEGLDGTGIEVPLTIRRRNGDVQTTVLDSGSPLYRVRPRASLGRVLRDYVGLGIEHIAIGVDHLLLVLGLVLASRGVRQLVFTITSFTVGHSVTLALASLGVLSVPGPPVEACIALSLVLLAVDLVRGSEPHGSERRRSPIWFLAVVFGLLHGLGFAGALAEVGIPRHAILPALVGFNVGVELGQLAFVACILAATAVARRTLSESRRAALLRRVPEAIGALSTYFLLERLVTLGS